MCAESSSMTTLPVWLGVSIGGIGQIGAPVMLDGTNARRLLELAHGRADAVMIMHTDIEVAGRALPILRRTGRARSAPIRTSASGRRPTGFSVRYRTGFRRQAGSLG